MLAIAQNFGNYVLLAAMGLAWQATADPERFAKSAGGAFLIVLIFWWGRRWLLEEFHRSPPTPGSKTRFFSMACCFLSWGCLAGASGLACLPEMVASRMTAFEQKALGDPVWNREAFVVVTRQVKAAAAAAGEDFSGYPDPVLGGTSFPAKQQATRRLLAETYTQATLDHFLGEEDGLGRWLMQDAGQRERIIKEAVEAAAPLVPEGGVIGAAAPDNPLVAGAMRATTKSIKNVLLDRFAAYMAFRREWLWMWAFLLQVFPFVIRLRAALADIKIIH